MIRCKTFSTKEQALAELAIKNIQYGFPKTVDNTLGGNCTITEVISVAEPLELVNGRWALFIDDESYTETITSDQVKDL